MSTGFIIVCALAFVFASAMLYGAYVAHIKPLFSGKPELIELTAPDVRPMSDEEKQVRGMRAKMALDEFLAPALNDIGAEYLTALTQMAANEPWETAKITKLAVAQRVIKMVEQHIISTVMDGVQADANLARAKKIAAIPEAKRKFL